MKVEHALRLLPALEAVAPLRSLLLSSAEPAEQAVWGSARPYLTVGKHEVAADRMRRQLPHAFRTVTTHLTELYGAFIDALEHIDRGDEAGAVARFLDAGRREQEVGRLEQARAWFATALEIAEALQDRRPEIEVLLALGRLCMYTGRYDEAARRHQRALALADAALDPAGATAACEGLGAVSVETGEWRGAHAWYARALRIAEEADDRSRVAFIRHATGEYLRRRCELESAAIELELAREAFEVLGNTHQLARVLCTQGLLAADRGQTDRAAAAYREALAWIRGTAEHSGLEVFIRLSMARLQVEAGQYLQAEDEIRRAEQIAIAANHIRRLVQLYALLGTVRGRQADDGGFVFFEQAIQLARAMEQSPILEAQVYRDYGAFMRHLGRLEEARAYFGRAQELFVSMGASEALRQLEGDMMQVTA